MGQLLISCVFVWLSLHPQVRSQRISCVHDVFVYNESMFLTVPSLSTFLVPDECEGVGKVLMAQVSRVQWLETSASLESELLLTVNDNNSSFNPHGVCTFRNVSSKALLLKNTFVTAVQIS